MPLHSTNTLLAALKTRLEALQWTPGGGSPEALFQKVEYFSEPDLIKALAEIRVARNRVCLVVPDDNDYANEVSGSTMTTGVERGVFLVIADRDHAAGKDALIGDARRPGVLLMEAKVIEDITGVNLGIRGVRVKPLAGRQVEIAPDDEKQIPGRKVRVIELVIEAGEMITQNNT